MWKLQIVETEHGATMILPDDLAARLPLEGRSELDVIVRDREIIVPSRLSPQGSAIVAD